MLTFKKLDSMEHRDEMLQFRKDAFKISFGDASDFDENQYVSWIEEKSVQFPEGYVMVVENDQIVGQLELSIKEYKGKMIGYIHLYYLIPEQRGQCKGDEIYQYAMRYFYDHNVNEYHLRVSPSNTRAINFYKKNGMQEVGLELDGKVIRMKGYCCSN
ncbi:GNAT family N-acetyltransferase [Aquibacillus sp. 3ASR75-11]|uniref:GNAT family N-acetyltransferase n=1 Tax=Terrihalobacillus insolitus TaxID=2950438 RepID=A0A9X4ANG4_9BACI|nr:GNAT family N-acetyltransferase [Terrihalobacillus insolitus]MDC3425799.1 GNAT family N-acetyltransferase [Terrihalobacillus insolitus]